MKKIFFLALTLTLAMTSCNQKSKEETTAPSMQKQDTTAMPNESNQQDTAEESEEHSDLYACPMHPEVQGKKDDKCSKCGMALTEPVTEKSEEK